MFREVKPQVSFAELDTEIAALWRAQNTAQRLLDGEGLAADAPRFTYYEGPPTANGMPHPGHVLTRVMKDLLLRFETMRGKRVLRRAGWDTHGLPVEVEVEKALGISGRDAIEAYGVGAFAERCLDSIWRYVDEWRVMTERIGFVVDLDDAYATYQRSYVESVWWALSELFKRGLLYQDYKVVWWWPQGGTALSAGEVGQGYRNVVDPSVTLRFRLEGQPKRSLLAWTTTPWTLPSNVGLAVNPKLDYAVMSDGEEELVVAAALASQLFEKQPHKQIETLPGSALLGLRYLPTFAFSEPQGGKAYEVIEADFVSTDAGTGIVHIAPAFGEDDFRVAKAAGLGFLQLVDPEGRLTQECGEFAGIFCKEADRPIIRALKTAGLLFSEAAYKHDYPFCWRKDSDPLIQYARKSWFIHTQKFKEQMLANNAEVYWAPEHIRDGRFGSFLRNNVDWAVSRERFWGTPLPIWINDVTGEMETVASCEEILARNPEAFATFDAAKAENPELSEDLRVHKPWIDEVTWTRAGEAGVYRRIPEVIDCWFDSGCMPFAQWGYPHRDQEAFHSAFPADIITEAVDQTRGWFYSLIAVSTLLFGDKQRVPHPFKRCMVMGLISDEKGQKLSKSKRNYEDPLPLMDKHGADAMRWALYTSTVPGQGTRWAESALQDAAREYLLKLWNAYSFLVTYARIDGWEPGATTPEGVTVLDRWVLAELEATKVQVTRELEALRPQNAARRLVDFVDALTNWYIRRSRDRFWAAGMQADKSAAYETLYVVLVELTQLSAPFTPFLCEALYQNLRRPYGGLESVHFERLPRLNAQRQDEALRREVELVRQVTTLGQRVRAERRLRVRQPLAQAVVVASSKGELDALQPHIEDLRSELNVQAIRFDDDFSAYATLNLIPNFKRLGPKLGARVKSFATQLKQMDESARDALAEALRRGETYTLSLPDGESYVLEADDVELRLSPKGEFAAAAAFGLLVALDTQMTHPLRVEGIARELVNRIQRLRKELDLPYQARIRVELEGAGPLVTEAVAAHGEAVRDETLCEALSTVAQLSDPCLGRDTTEIESETLQVAITRTV